MIEVTDINYSQRGTDILRNITLSASEGIVTGIIGPNGAGKSTILGMMYKMLAPDSGAVYIDGQNIVGLRRRDIAQSIAVVAQKYEDTLPLTVRDSVALGLLNHAGAFTYGNDAGMDKVDRALEHVGLTELAHRLTHELSGGEFQRVLIARAIVQNTKHLLLDEPTNHLDIHHQHRILELVRTLQLTTTIVLHDLNLAMQFCDRLILLDHGAVVASGMPEEVLTPERVTAIYQIETSVIKHQGRNHLLFLSQKGRTIA